MGYINDHDAIVAALGNVNEAFGVVEPDGPNISLLNGQAHPRDSAPSGLSDRLPNQMTPPPAPTVLWPHTEGQFGHLS